MNLLLFALSANMAHNENVACRSADSHAASSREHRGATMAEVKLRSDRLDSSGQLHFLRSLGKFKPLTHEDEFVLARQIREPLLTCDAVLAETAFHLGSSAATSASTAAFAPMSRRSYEPCVFASRIAPVNQCSVSAV